MITRSLCVAIIFMFATRGRAIELSSCDATSLRSAIAVGGEITFACDGTITLTNTMVVTRNVTLRANGRNVTISGGGVTRLFHVVWPAQLALEGLVLADGFVRGLGFSQPQDGFGACIFNDGGALGATQCTFLHNRTIGGANTDPAGHGARGFGGAIYNRGRLLLTNCVFAHNECSGGAGGGPVFNRYGTGGSAQGGAVASFGGGDGSPYPSASAYMTGCIFSNNIATFYGSGVQPGQTGGDADGGAVFVEAGLIAIGCRFVSNYAVGGLGGPTVSGSGITGAGGRGRGGAFVGQGQFRDCVFEQNTALGGNGGAHSGAPSSLPGYGGVAEGGAIYGVGQFERCRVVRNTAVPGYNQMLGVAYGTMPVYGGGVVNVGYSSFVGCQLRSNTAASPVGGAAYGGMAYQKNWQISFEECDISMNRAIGGESGRYTNSQTFIGNAYGGAVYLEAGQMRATNSTFAFNSALAGLQKYFAPAAEAFGGAVHAGMFSVNVTNIVENCTFAANQARGGTSLLDVGGMARGGAIHGPNFLVSQCTIVGNVAQGGTRGRAQGGGIYWGSSLRGVILSANVPTNWAGPGGMPMDLGYNISSDRSPQFSQTTSSMNVDSKMGTLGDYGGPTQTIPLLNGSPAIDAIMGTPCLAHDQRGRARPYGAGCDIGAFESSAPFTVRGRITGPWVMSGIEVSNGAETTITAADFSYRFDGLAPGNYAITPSQVTHLVVPGTRTASVDTDVVDVDFTAYRWNSLSLEKSGQGLLKVSYAGTNAKAVVIQSTTTPPAWQDYSTNEVGADGLIQLQVPTVDTQRLFRVVVP